MKIITKCKIKYFDDEHGHGLELKVKFKLPNQIFNRTKTKTLCNSQWILPQFKDLATYKTYDDFLKDCLLYLNNKEKIKNEVYEMINSYIEAKNIQEIKEKGIDEVKLLVKDKFNKEFTIEVEIK